MTTPRIWLLPSRPDPEAEAIARLLDEAGENTSAAWDDPRVEQIRACGGTIYAVEREDWPAWADRAVVVCIDHHNPGDPGYGRPPGQFLPASSLGQVIETLASLDALPPSWAAGVHGAPGSSAGTKGQIGYLSNSCAWAVVDAYRRDVFVPHALVLTAAADHCLGAAYRGECPGVDPDDLMRWRAASRAAFQRRSVEAVLADVVATTAALLDAPTVALSGPALSTHTEDHDWSSSMCDGCCDAVEIRVADMRRDPPWPELPEAAARAGLGYISGPLIGPDGKRKFTCSGLPEQVRAFMSVWAPNRDLAGVYGDPARGFAGGYETD